MRESRSFVLMLMAFYVIECRHFFFRHKENIPLKTIGFVPYGKVDCKTNLQCAVICACSSGCVLVDLSSKTIYRQGAGDNGETKIKHFLLSEQFSEEKNNSLKPNFSSTIHVTNSLKGMSSSPNQLKNSLKGMSSPPNQLKNSLKGMSSSPNQLKNSLKGTSASQNQNINSLKGTSASQNKVKNSLEEPVPRNNAFLMAVVGNHMKVRNIVVGSMFSKKVNDTGIKTSKDVKAIVYDPGTKATFWSVAAVWGLGRSPGIFKRKMKPKAKWVQWMKKDCLTSELYVFKDRLYGMCGMPGIIWTHSTLKRFQGFTEWHRRPHGSVERIGGNDDHLCWMELSHGKRHIYCSTLPQKKDRYLDECKPAISFSTFKFSNKIITAFGESSYGQPIVLTIGYYDANSGGKICQKTVDIGCTSYIQSVGIDGNLVYSTCTGTKKLEARKIEIGTCTLALKPKVTEFPTKSLGRNEYITFSFM